MCSILSSQAVVLASAMVVSTTVIFLAFSRQHKSSSPAEHNSDQPLRKQGALRSCLCSEEKKKLKRKKNKRVKFAESVKEPNGNGEQYRRERGQSMDRVEMKSCRTEIRGMPANRVALYTGILRDRVHRMQCSY